MSLPNIKNEALASSRRFLVIKGVLRLKLGKSWGLVLLGLGAVCALGWSRPAMAKTSQADEVKAAYIVDAKSGQAIYADRADEKLPIASLSKLMTLYLVVHAVKNGQLRWTDNVPISHEVRKLAESATLSTMPMGKNEKFTVRELFAATLVGSSNSSAIALGELVGGSNAKFIQLMNKQAQIWRLDAEFVSASGLDNTDLTTYHYNLPGTSDQAQNLVSARAVSTIAQKLLAADPEVISIANHGSIKVHQHRVATSVQILKGQPYYDAEAPVDGLKTGYTAQAGDCLVATFKHDGRRLIATTLGGTWKYSANANFRLMVQRQEHYRQVVPKTIDYQIPGTTTKVTLVAKNGVKRWDNTKRPVQRKEVAVWPLHRDRPNYLPAGQTVMQYRLTDTTSGAVTTVDYVTPKAKVLLGPLHLATTSTNHTSLLQLPLAFAN